MIKRLQFQLQEGHPDWVIIADGKSAGLVSLGEVSGSTVNVPAYTTMILVDKRVHCGYQCEKKKEE